MAHADDIISALRSEGQVDSEGQFTLDRDMARRKLHNFQLAEPLSYVLLLVQAAVLKGANQISVDVGSSELQLRFDRRHFSLDELQDIHNEMFAASSKHEKDGNAEGRRHLALGLAAAMSSGATLVRVTSGAEEVAYLELRPGEKERCGVTDGPQQVTRIVVRRPFLSVRRFFASLSNTLVEEKLLRERCANCRTAIDLEGQKISQGHVLPYATFSQSFAVPGLEGRLGLSDMNAETELRLLQHGVLLDAHSPRQLLPGFSIIAESPRLRRDISLTKVVTDDNYRQLLNQLLEVQIDWLATQCRSSIDGRPSPPRQQLRALLVELLHRQPDINALRAITKGPRAAFMAFPLLMSSDSKEVTLGALIEEVSQVGRLCYSDEAGPPPQGHKLAVMVSRQMPPILKHLQKVLNRPLHDVSQQVLTAQLREDNLRRWKKRPAQDKLWHEPYLLRLPIAGSGVRGELGYKQNQRPGLTLLLVRDDYLLFEAHTTQFSQPLEALLIANFEPNYTLDKLCTNAVWQRAVDALWQALEALCESLAGALGQDSKQRRHALRRLIAEVTDPEVRKTVGEKAAGLAASDFEGQLVPFGPRQPLLPPPPALWEARLFETAVEGLLSLKQLAARLANNGLVVVAYSQHDAAVAAAWNARFGEGMPAEARAAAPIVLWAPDSETRLVATLRYLLKSERVISGQDWLATLARNEQQARQIAGFGTYDIGTTLATVFSRGDVEGEIGYKRRVTLNDGELMLTLFQRGVYLARIPVYLPGGDDLVASVNSLSVRMNPDGAHVVDDQSMGTVRTALCDAVPALLDELLDDRDPFKYRTYFHLMSSLLCAIFPGPLFREAYDVLWHRGDATRVNEEYLTLLRLVSAFGAEAVERPLRWYLTPERTLDVTQVVRALIKDQVAEEPARAHEKPQPPEIPGGLHWLDVLFPDSTGVQPFHLRALQPIPLLRDAPLFQDTVGRPLRLSDLVKQLEETGAVRYQRQGADGIAALPQEEAISSPLLAVRNQATHKVLASLFSAAWLRQESCGDVLSDATPENELPWEDPEDADEEDVVSSELVEELTEDALAEPTAEDVFLSAILEELSHAGEFDARLLSGINLNRIVIGDASPEIAVSCSAERTLINRRHPLMRRGIDDPAVGSLWRFFAVSAVYTALNEYLQEVTDVDEAVFLHWLSDRAAMH